MMYIWIAVQMVCSIHIEILPLDNFELFSSPSCNWNELSFPENISWIFLTVQYAKFWW